MTFLKITGCVPPKELWTDPSAQDKHGYTQAMNILFLTHCDVPKELHHDPSIINNNGHNIHSFAMQRNCPVHEWMFDKEHRTKYTSWSVTAENQYLERGIRPPAWLWNYDGT